MNYLYRIIALLIVGVNLWTQDLRINEVIPSNSSTIEDIHGEFPDWVEFYNNSEQTINLEGYGFTDDPDEPYKWVFPDTDIEPHEHLLVFASGNECHINGGHWETCVDWGDTWKYKIMDSEPSEQWKLAGYDDSSWSEGPSGIGYGDDDDATIVPQTISVHMRKTFNVENASDIMQAFLHIDYDDAFAAYINGEPITITISLAQNSISLHNMFTRR